MTNPVTPKKSCVSQRYPAPPVPLSTHPPPGEGTDEGQQVFGGEREHRGVIKGELSSPRGPRHCLQHCRELKRRDSRGEEGDGRQEQDLSDPGLRPRELRERVQRRGEARVEDELQAAGEDHHRDRRRARPGPGPAALLAITPSTDQKSRGAQGRRQRAVGCPGSTRENCGPQPM